MALQISERKTADLDTSQQIKLKVTQLKKIKKQLATAADKDLEVFNRFRYLPKNITDKEKQSLQKKALLKAIKSPLQAASVIIGSLEIIQDCISNCNETVVSDFSAGIMLLHASADSILILAQSNIKMLPTAEKIPYNTLKNQLDDKLQKVTSEITL